jgi:hypothetical protein
VLGFHPQFGCEFAMSHDGIILPGHTRPAGSLTTLFVVVFLFGLGFRF